MPLRISGTLRNGTPFALAGPVSLRRANDVNGATPAQLRRHIIKAALTPQP